MLPGPDDVIECPACESPVRDRTILSGNTFGAVRYTDGYMDAPMMPNVPMLAVCPTCDAAFLRTEARRLSSIHANGLGPWQAEDGSEPPPEWRRAGYAVEPVAGDYQQFLAGRSLERDAELGLRLEWWHVGNHARRKLAPGAAYPVPGRDEVRNLGRLAALCDEDDLEQRLLLAEITRELGVFGLAEQMLDEACAKAFPDATARLLELVRARNPRVAELFPREEDDEAEREELEWGA